MVPVILNALSLSFRAKREILVRKPRFLSRSLSLRSRLAPSKWQRLTFGGYKEGSESGHTLDETALIPTGISRSRICRRRLPAMTKVSRVSSRAIQSNLSTTFEKDRLKPKSMSQEFQQTARFLALGARTRSNIQDIHHGFLFSRQRGRMELSQTPKANLPFPALL